MYTLSYYNYLNKLNLILCRFIKILSPLYMHVFIRASDREERRDWPVLSHSHAVAVHNPSMDTNTKDTDLRTVYFGLMVKIFQFLFFATKFYIPAHVPINHFRVIFNFNLSLRSVVITLFINIICYLRKNLILY